MKEMVIRQVVLVVQAQVEGETVVTVGLAGVLEEEAEVEGVAHHEDEAVGVVVLDASQHPQKTLRKILMILLHGQHHGQHHEIMRALHQYLPQTSHPPGS